jgi:hypothetical protein
VGVPVTNNSIIRAEGGQLTMSGGGTNSVSGQIQAPAGATVFYSSGLAANAGTIALSGGTFDNNNFPLASSGTIDGQGTIRTGGLTNTGTINVADGTTTFFGAVINSGTVKITSNTTTFLSPVTNNTGATIKTTSGIARVLGGMSGGGTYTSDPADNYFTDISITGGGSVSGGPGDRFFVSGTYTNAGTYTNGGELAAHPVVNNGAFNQTAGLAAMTTLSGTGATSLTGAGTQLLASSIRQGSLTIGVGAKAKIADNLGVKANGVSVLGSLDLGGGAGPFGTLDLYNNDLVVTYPSGGTSPEAQMQAYAKAGLNQANPTGLVSSHSNVPGFSSKFRTLAVFDNHDAHFSSFDAVALTMDWDQVIVKYTYAGDANVDGRVDPTDYAAVDGNQGKGHNWVTGDLNFDGKVDPTDYAQIDGNQGAGFGGDGGARLNSTLGGGLGAIPVPEPGTISLLAIGVMGLLGRRRRQGDE